MKHPNYQQKPIAQLFVGVMLGCLVAGPALAGQESAAIKRGAYLVHFGGCADCHTPLKIGPKGPEKDMSLSFAGHPEKFRPSASPKLSEGDWNWAGATSMTAFVGPWGVSYSANLTPDPETGIGKWSADDFIKAMRTGKHAGVGRPIMPPMPWQGLGQLKDGDLRAIYAYLKAQPAIRNQVPEYQPPVASAK